MKPFTVITLLALLCLFSETTIAAPEIVQCRATCVAVTSDNVRVLGYAKGASEIDEQEAFDLMERDCRLRAEDAGVGTDTLLVSAIEVATASAHAESFSSSSFRVYSQIARPFEFRVRSYGSASGESSSESMSDSRSLSYKGKTVGFEACRPVTKNPAGRPRYTGPERPWG